MIVRFLIGVGKAAACPNFNRTAANWCGPHERGLGIALTINGIGIGSALTTPITAWIMVNYGWQTAFYVAGALGVVICLDLVLVCHGSPGRTSMRECAGSGPYPQRQPPAQYRRQANACSLEGVCPHA